MVWRSCSHNVVSLSQNFMIPKKFWRFVEWSRHSSGKFQGVTKGFLSYSRKRFQRFDAVGLALRIRSLISSFTRCPVSEMLRIHKWKSLVLMELVIPRQCTHFCGVHTLPWRAHAEMRGVGTPRCRTQLRDSKPERVSEAEQGLGSILKES